MQPCSEQQRYESEEGAQKTSTGLALTLKLLQNHSTGIHPGHQPGRHNGPPAEFEGMTFDGWKWRMNGTTGAAAADGVLAELPEQEQQLARRFEGSGGLGLCLMRSFTMPDVLRERAKKKLLEASGNKNLLPPGKLNGSDDDWSVFDKELAKEGDIMDQVNMLLRMSEYAEETEAIRRNVWTDIDFNLGEAENMELLSHLELQFAGQLSKTAKRMEAQGRIPSSCRAPISKDDLAETSGTRIPDGIFDIALQNCDEAATLAQRLSAEDLNAILNEPRNLGVALDLVGAYVKNYEIDKADCILDRIKPLCRERGQMWLCKWLDKCTLIRLKQYRAHEALDALHETERLVPFTPEEGWQFFEILYRNLARACSAVDRTQESLHYLHRAAEVKQANGIEASWFDIWDLGRAHSQLGQASQNRDEIIAGYELCLRALEIVRVAEPGDTVIIAKLLANIGEICLGIGDGLKESDPNAANSWYLKAVDPLRESFDLHLEAHGPQKPLVGWQAGVLSHCMARLGKWTEAQKYIGHALKVECTKDATTPGCLVELVDRVMGIHLELKDLPGMRVYVSDLEMVLGNLQRRGLSSREPELFIFLLEKVATLLLSCNDGDLLPKALSLLQEAEMLLLDMRRDVGLGKRRAQAIDARSKSGFCCKEDSDYKVLENNSCSSKNNESIRCHGPEMDLDKLLADVSKRIRILSVVEEKVETLGDADEECPEETNKSSGKGFGEKSRQKCVVPSKVQNTHTQSEITHVITPKDDWEIAD